jgi:hypothetical protein
MTGVGTIAGGILLAIGILVMIGILIFAVLSFEPPKPNPRPLTILDTPEGMTEASYYRSQNCQANDEGNWICPENTISWTDFQGQK